jgi:7-cyano-7-deazaguanine tRNA-ribosyltransferase
MAFELRNKDLMGRIGRLTTKRGVVETPAFLPVINPLNQVIPPRRMHEEFGCDILITNAYIVRNHFKGIQELDIHNLLDYPGVVMTDSGAYQILVYGGVEVTQEEIIEYQKEIDSDIAVILDIPTGWDVPRSRVEYTVDRTLNRAREALPLIEDHPTLWVGPIQGGRHLDLVEESAKKIGEMPFDIHALGSPTEVMERYLFPVLVDMVMMAKTNIPLDRPFHLFGAGHPMMFSLAVALGCDLFDSASYALYAKDDRYLTPRGTLRLQDIRYLPCSCPICRNNSARDLKDKVRGERIRLLTEHNLHICMAEMDKIKQAITDGTLWDLIEARARGHPSMLSALKELAKYRGVLEEHNSGFKGRGVFFYDYHTLSRPEITRYNKRLLGNYGKTKDSLLLLKAPPTTPYRKDPQYRALLKGIPEEIQEGWDICFYDSPYGCIPASLSETYPLSQSQIAEPIDYETLRFTVEGIKEYLRSARYGKIILLRGYDRLDVMVEEVVMDVTEETSSMIRVLRERDPWMGGGAIKVHSELNQI